MCAIRYLSSFCLWGASHGLVSDIDVQVRTRTNREEFDRISFRGSIRASSLLFLLTIGITDRSRLRKQF